MAIVVVLAILFSCILLILCLPITYALTVHIGTPFQVEGQGSWGRKLADASWSYSLGEEPHHELHTCWKRSPAVKEPVETPPPTPEEAKQQCHCSQDRHLFGLVWRYHGYPWHDCSITGHQWQNLLHLGWKKSNKSYPERYLHHQW